MKTAHAFKEKKERKKNPTKTDTYTLNGAIQIKSYAKFFLCCCCRRLRQINELELDVIVLWPAP